MFILFRVYYHGRNNQHVVHHSEFDYNSEDEKAPDWLQEKTQNVSYSTKVATFNHLWFGHQFLFNTKVFGLTNEITYARKVIMTGKAVKMTIESHRNACLYLKETGLKESKYWTPKSLLNLERI